MKYFLIVIPLFLIIAGCKKKEGCTDPSAPNFNPQAEVDNGTCQAQLGCPSCDILQGSITTDETWTNDHIYLIQGKVVVSSGATLTIEPGTIIKAQEGVGTLAAMLVVSKGSKIIACGTPQQPIIFTSVLDNIQPGQLTGTNLNEYDTGLWGGILLCGEAPISSGDGDTTSYVEGIPVNYSFGSFGGHTPLDNSGSLCYVSIRHAGSLIGAGNEMGGLTLAGVGSGTNINNVEVVASLGDGLDIHGGTVDVSNVTIGFNEDDGIDINMNYDGTISDFTVVAGTNTDEGVEIHEPEGTTYTNGTFELINGSFPVVGGVSINSHELKGDLKGNISNVDFYAPVKVDVQFDVNCNLAGSVFTNVISNPTLLEFTNIDYATIMVQDEAGSQCTISNQDQQAFNALTSQGTPTGNSNTDILWTWLSANGIL